jgi:acylphosphatase
MRKIRQRIRFYGQVQGVGFRYTAQYEAQRLGLTGWVGNEWDGTVLMEVQGDEQDILHLIQSLESDRFIEIDRIEKQLYALDERETNFTIRY